MQNSDTPHPETRDGKASGDQSAPAGGLTRVTANLVPRAIAALEEITQRTGDSRTDALNRAVQVYKAFLDLSVDDTLTVIGPDGQQQKIRFL